MKKRKNVRTFWVAREGGVGSFDDYVLSASQRMRHDPMNPGLYSALLPIIAADDWHRLTGVRLKPGEGPIEVLIERVVRAAGKFAARPKRKGKR